jgi:hypothetical protein
MSLSGSAVDDPDNQFYENYSCGSSRNYTGCNPERRFEINPVAPSLRYAFTSRNT